MTAVPREVLEIAFGKCMAINAHPPEKVKRAVSAGGECGNVYFLHPCASATTAEAGFDIGASSVAKIKVRKRRVGDGLLHHEP